MLSGDLVREPLAGHPAGFGLTAGKMHGRFIGSGPRKGGSRGRNPILGVTSESRYCQNTANDTCGRYLRWRVQILLSTGRSAAEARLGRTTRVHFAAFPRGRPQVSRSGARTPDDGDGGGDSRQPTVLRCRRAPIHLTALANALADGRCTPHSVHHADLVLALSSGCETPLPVWPG